jgi:colanic acid biosynthesis glycosyl transferase WcaI
MSRQDKFRILVINQYFPPDTSATAKTVSGAVAALGRHYQVTVLAGRPSYDPAEQHPYYLWRKVHWNETKGDIKEGSAKPGNIIVERVGSSAYNRCWLPGRILNYFSYLPLAFLRALFIPCDLIIVFTDPPIVCMVGALVARLRRRPYIYNIKDLHPDMALCSGVMPHGHLARLWERFHRTILHRADRVVVLGEDMKKRVSDKGISPERISIVRDGLFPNEIYSSSDDVIVREIRCGFSFVALHAGNLGFAVPWENFSKAAKKIEGRAAGLGIIFVGDGAVKAKMESSAEGLRSVKFLPYRPHSEVSSVLRSADLHIVSIRQGVEGLVVPSKIYPILAAGRPILVVASKKSDAARIVQKHQCGFVASPEDPEDISKALLWAYQHPSDLEIMGKRALEAAKFFTFEKQMSNLIHTVREVVT